MGLMSAIGGALKGIGGTIVKNIPVIGSIAGGVMDYVSQEHANKANAQNVDKQIAFQDLQSRTQYQRATADMEAAGLNPALAYEQGGNTAETGAAARAEPLTTNTASKFATASQVYNDIANGVAQRDLLRSQANAQDASTLLTRAQAAAAQPAAALGTDEEYIQTWNRTQKALRAAERYGAEHEPERFQAALSNIGAGTAQANAQAYLARTQSTLNEQDFQHVLYRQMFAPWANDARSIVKALSPFGGR